MILELWYGTHNIFGIVEFITWWLKEKPADTELPKDIKAVGKRLIVFDVNGVLLKSYFREPPEMHLWQLHPKPRPTVCRVGGNCWCAVRPDAEDVLMELSRRADIMIWSCCRRQKLLEILRTCLPRCYRQGVFKGIGLTLF